MALSSINFINFVEKYLNLVRATIYYLCNQHKANFLVVLYTLFLEICSRFCRFRPHSWLDSEYISTDLKCVLRVRLASEMYQNACSNNVLFCCCLLFLWLTISLWLSQVPFKLILSQLFNAWYLVLPLITVKLTASTPFSIILSLTPSTPQWINVIETENAASSHQTTFRRIAHFPLVFAIFSLKLIYFKNTVR